MAGRFPLVLDSVEFLARSGTVPGPIGTCHEGYMAVHFV